MVKFLINRPIAVIMVYVALLLLGSIATLNIPISPLPNIDIPEITVHVNQKNASSQELESMAIKGLRAQLMQVPKLEDIYSETGDGYSILHLKFDYGTDINYAFLEVNEKVDLSMSNLPREMERPRVVKASSSDIPVFFISMRWKNNTQIDSSPRFVALSGLAENAIKRRLEQLPEIAFVDITGVSYPEISITPNSARMTAINLKEEDLKEIIASNNLTFDNIPAMDGVFQYNIRLSASSPISVEDIKNIKFKHADRIFQLTDIADIDVRSQDTGGSFISDNQPAVSLAIIKQPDAKMEKLRSNVTRLMQDFRSRYSGICFEQTQDQTELLEFSISGLKQDLVIGSILAFILMFFFLRNFLSPLLLCITVPVCLVITLLFFNIIHLSINIISLSGLVLGIGLMIDNSIIVIDNITQYRERGAALPDACIRGTTEIIRPLLSSVLTTCSVFLPLLFLSGISGALFYDQAMAITLGVSVSLVVSITLLPTLYHLFHTGKVRNMNHDFFEKYGISFFERVYDVGFVWVFRNKMATLLIVIVFLSCNIFLFNHLKKEKLPKLKQAELVTYIDWNENITIAENKERVSLITKGIANFLQQSTGMIGKQQYLLSKEKQLSSSEAQIYTKVKGDESLEMVKGHIQNYLKTNYPAAKVKHNAPPNIFEKVFGEDKSPLVVQLIRPTKETLPSRTDVAELIRKMNKAFPPADISNIGLKDNLTLIADPEMLLFYDLSIDAVYARLRSALHASEVGKLRDGQRSIPLVVSDQTNDLNYVLNNVTVINSKGIPLPLNHFLRISHEKSYKTIEAGKNGPYVALSIEKAEPGQVINYVNQTLKGNNKLAAIYSGSYFSNQKLLWEMMVVLVVSVLLLYFILAAQFESLIQPLIVLFELPIGMSGALIMLYFFNATINLISLIGLVVMCGIVINDSILKINLINQLRRNEGYDLKDAIHTGGKRRLKSIIMTAMTTILSVVPFLFGDDMGSMLQRPLSLALIGGMLIGTPVSLYFIPLAYWFYYKNEDKVGQTTG